MKDWQSYFLEETLDLGYSYFLEECVHEPTFEKQQLTAKITTDKERTATIVLDEEHHILHTACDCLCSSVEQCPHLVALLFDYDSRFPKEHEQELTELIAYADETQIKDFLFLILQENQRLAQRFHRHIYLDELADFEKLEAIIGLYENNYNGVISSEKVDEFVADMTTFTEKIIDRSIKTKKILHGFDVLNEVVEVIDFSEIDDSTQAVDHLMAYCYASWKRLIQQASAEEREEMIQTLADQENDPQRIYSTFYIHKLLNEKPSNDPEETSPTPMNDVPEKKEANAPKRWLSVNQMVLLDYSESQIQQAVKENWVSPVTRSQYIDYLQKKKAYTQAVDVLIESIELDKHSPDLVLLHRYSLKSLYQKLGNTLEYAKQIYHLLIDSNAVDMNLIHQLKKACTPDEWKKYSTDLFEKLQNHKDVGLFYSQEKRYDLLLDYVLKSPGLEEASQYFIDLKKHAPEALLQKYEYELRKMAQPTGTRPRYHKIARLIEEMASLPNSIVSAQLLVKELKEKYPRRKALLEELKIVEKKL